MSSPYLNFGNQPEVPSGELSLNRTLAGLYGWLFGRTGLTVYRDMGDEWFDSTFGGPTDGPGGLSSTYSTIGSALGPIGGEVDLNQSLLPCAANPQPCAGFNGDIASNLGKNFGQAFGFPNTDSYPAWRLLVASPAGQSALSSTIRSNVTGRDFTSR